ncbi:MAG: glycosyltransferase family 2 protein [Clostridiales bacterium]|jgi:glycosyltransferase involved in cell wall biosynthesis|nr:glycosyltransferase family 2 protein [Clostridiales bacterium]
MIYILLASYNGEKFIEEQLRSLLAQTEQNFILFVNDDKSTDNTYKILQEYSKMYPEKIFATQNDTNSGSAKHNFFKLMTECKSDYVMLCDQDDIWLPDKIEKTLKKMHELEHKYSKDTPIAIRTNLTVVDENLKIIKKSMWTKIRQINRNINLRTVLGCNVITGCTAMYNRALADLIFGNPKYFIMHDYWLALIACAFGKVGSLLQPTILYRQHANNCVGFKKTKSNSCDLYNTFYQAHSFLDVYSTSISKKNLKLINSYIQIPKMNKVCRVWTMVKLRTFCSGGPLKKILHVLLIFRSKKLTGY